MREEVKGNNWEGQRRSLVALLGAFHSKMAAAKLPRLRCMRSPGCLEMSLNPCRVRPIPGGPSSLPAWPFVRTACSFTPLLIHSPHPC